MLSLHFKGTNWCRLTSWRKCWSVFKKKKIVNLYFRDFREINTIFQDSIVFKTNFDKKYSLQVFSENFGSSSIYIMCKLYIDNYLFIYTKHVTFQMKILLLIFDISFFNNKHIHLLAFRNHKGKINYWEYF